MKVMKRMTRMMKKIMEQVQTIRVAVQVAVQQSHLQMSQTLIHMENWMKGWVYEKEEH